MKRALGALAVAGLALMFTGCGTIANLAGTVVPLNSEKEFPMVYGGVQVDLAFVQSGPFLGSAPGDARGALIGLGLLMADFPASLVGDTLTLPLVLGIYHIRKSLRDDDAPKRPAPSIVPAESTSPKTTP